MSPLLKTVILLFSAMASMVSANPVADGEDIVLGEYRVLQSKILGEERIISVYLPQSYIEGTDSYPVLYLNGGRTILHALLGSLSMEWQSGSGAIPEMIVVVIDHVNGVRDYLPTPQPNRPGSGQAANYMRFLTEELIPFIDANYRTIDYRVLSGFSTAGIFVLDAFLTNFSQFDAYIIASAEIGWVHDYIIKTTTDCFDQNRSLPTHFYFSYGSDDYLESVVEPMPDYIKIFEDRAPSDLNWKFELVENGGHVPFTTLYNGLSFIFPGWKYPDEQPPSDGLTGIKQFYSDLSGKYGFSVPVPTALLYQFGIEHIRGQEYDKASELFGYVIETQPEDAEAHYWMGEISLRQDDRETARKYFEKTLELNPSHNRAKSKLEQLKG